MIDLSRQSISKYCQDHKISFLHEKLTAALLLFIVTIYAPFAVAGSFAGISDARYIANYASFALIFMALGTLLSTWLTRLSLVIAPGIGFVSIYVNTSKAHVLTLPQMRSAAIVAGIICLALTLIRSRSTSIRFQILDSIPNEIKLGVKAGVGVVLATQAIESIGKHVEDKFLFDAEKTSGFLVGISILIVLDALAQLELKRSKEDKLLIYTLLLGLMQVFIPIILGIIYYINTPGQAFTQSAPFHDFFMLPDFRFSGAREIIFAWGCFSAMIAYIIITDIPGTPYEMLEIERADNKDYIDITKRIVNRSFVVDSGLAIINSIFCLSPSIYYSENFVVKHFKHEVLKSRLPATLCAVGYLFFGVLVLRISLPIYGLKDWLIAATAPVLFMIALKMTASSMLADHEKGIQDGQPAGAPKTFTLYYYMPAAATALATHFVDLSFGIPVGIIIYIVYALAIGEEPEKPVWALGVVSLFILVFFFLFQVPSDSSCRTKATANWMGHQTTLGNRH